MPSRLDRFQPTCGVWVRRATVAMLAIAALAGCGGQHSDRPGGNAPTGSGGKEASTTSASTSRSSAPRGRVVLLFKRELGVDPLASYFTLYASGRGIATVVYGGRDGAKVHSFELAKPKLERLERLLRHARLKDTGIADPNLYTYWVITPRSSYRLSQGVLPRSSRPLLAELNAIADANHLF